jgi:hypothetical protein
MTAEEKLVQTEAEVQALRGQVASLERVLSVAIDVMSEQQFGEMRARLDSMDATR